MKTTLEICLFLLLIGLPIYFFYWRLFRPILIVRLRYRIFKARDDLRLLALSGEMDKKDRAYPILERCCNRCITILEVTDISDLFTVRLDKQTTLEAERDLQIINQSSVQLRGVFRDVACATIGAACVNSPGALVAISPFMVFSVFALWLGRFKNAVDRLFTHTWAVLYLNPS